jgi:hypothetical protein
MTATKTQVRRTKSLLFINKDATSVSFSQSEAHVRRKINRHVQHWQLGTKFATKQRALRECPASRISVAANDKTSNNQNGPVTGLAGRSFTAPSSLEEQTSTLTTNAESAEGDASVVQAVGAKQQPAEDEAALSRTRPGLPLPPVLCSRGNGVDPFSSTATPIDHTTHNLIQHYIRVLVPSTFRVEAHAYRSTTTRHAASTFEVVRRSMSNEMHMAALLAVSASRVKHVVKKDLGKNSAEAFMYNAVRALRKHLRSESVVIDQATILDIFWLFQAESYSRRYDASMVHLRIVKQLVEGIGGLRMLDRYMMESIMIGDILVSIETFVPPIFPFICDPGGLEPSQISALSMKMDSQLRCLGQGFIQEHLCLELRLVISDLVHCMQMAQWLWSQSKPDPNDVKWTTLRSYSLLHRLLSVSLSTQSDLRLHGKEECCRVALIMWLGQVTTSTGVATRSGNMNAGRLKDRLLEYGMLDPGSCADTRLLAWMLVVGAFATANTDTEAWFLVALRKILAELHIKGNDRFRNMLEEYFYLDGMQSKSLQRIGKELLGD